MKLHMLGALAVSLTAVTLPAVPAHAVDIPARAGLHAVIPAEAGIHSVIPAGAGIHALRTSAAKDPADSLYRAAREALANGDYEAAARMFHEVGVRYPKSALLPDAMYYEAFARYRVGGSASMRSAHDILASLQQRYPEFGHRSDAATLSTRICGELAKQGDAACAATISAQASATAASGSSASGMATDKCPADDNDERIAALNALLQMDADRAEPILEKVLARRDECSAALRRKAVFLVVQKQSPQAVDVLLRVAQTDPDPEVRSQAVFWMSQVQGDRAVSVLSQILHNSSDMELRKKALFALAQSNTEHATTIVRDIATDGAQSVTLRETAIFWLGQQKDGVQNVQFLRDLYGKLTEDALKEKVLFSLSQGQATDRAAWLLQVAQRSNESVSMREKALFYAGQAGASMTELSRLYDSLPAGALREQMIFVFSQRGDPAALDKLISIAKTDKDANSRKKALFWLGQSHDPRAMKALTEVIEK